MTRVLSELLGAIQPQFGMTIQQLERAAGRPSTDIRLTSEILQRVQEKLHILGLDPRDTTSKELYQALSQRFHRDEALAREALKITANSTSYDTLRKIIKFTEKNTDQQITFALKNSVAKRLLKKMPPKRAMKQLGYRSLDSMLKHEAVPHMYVAAFLCESLTWRKKFLDQYVKLQSSDFELRPVEVSLPKAARWTKFMGSITLHQDAVVSFKELGAVVVLPLERKASGFVLANLTLLLSALNDISSTTSFLKLQQVKPDFGSVVRTIAETEPLTTAELVNRSVPWRVVHQYYARFTQAYNSLIFEPHVQPSDLHWLHPESLLPELHPALDFWLDTRYTAHIHGTEKVSFNIFDVAMNYYNQLPFTKRTSQAIQRSLWQELMIRYLDHANVEQAIAGELEAQPAYAEIEDA